MLSHDKETMKKKLSYCKNFINYANERVNTFSESLMNDIQMIEEVLDYTTEKLPTDNATEPLLRA